MTTDNQTPETPDVAPAEKTTKRQMSFSVLDTGEIRADFGAELEPLILAPASVPEEIQAAAVTEGLISRLRGATSKLADADRTPENLRAAIQKGMENLLAGIWKIERAPGTAEVSIEVEAAWLFRKLRAESKGEEFTGTIAEAAENFAQLTDEQKKTLKALPRYQAAAAQVKADRQAKKAAKLSAEANAAEDDSPF